MKCLTIDAPWAWAIIAGHKRVENRSWGTHHRGPLAIHAGRSARSDADAYDLFDIAGVTGPTSAELVALRGCLLGIVDVVAMWEDPPAKPFLTELGRHEFGAWWIGPVGWELTNPRPLATPLSMRGKQGLWTLVEPLEALA